jgi:hypothetical protein
VIHADDGFCDIQHLACRQELEQRARAGGQNRGAAANEQPEAAGEFSSVDLHARNPTEIVDRGEGMVLGAAFEGNLELSRQHR